MDPPTWQLRANDPSNVRPPPQLPTVTVTSEGGSPSTAALMSLSVMGAIGISILIIFVACALLYSRILWGRILSSSSDSQSSTLAAGDQVLLQLELGRGGGEGAAEPSPDPDQGLDPALIRFLPQGVFDVDSGVEKQPGEPGAPADSPADKPLVLVVMPLGKEGFTLTTAAPPVVCPQGAEAEAKKEALGHDGHALEENGQRAPDKTLDAESTAGEEGGGQADGAETVEGAGAGEVVVQVRGGRECAVCLSEYVQGDVLKWLPTCQHAFHGECIQAWLSSKTTCPLCRVHLAPALEALASAAGKHPKA